METKLLYVEDNLSLMSFVGRHLKEIRPDWSVMPAATLGEARSALNHNPLPDAAVLDINLPDGNGVDLLGEIKSLIPRLPVIMVSGAYSDALFARVVRKGGYTLMEKPFSINSLISNIESAVRLAALPRIEKITTALALRDKNLALATRPAERQIQLYTPNRQFAHYAFK